MYITVDSLWANSQLFSQAAFMSDARERHKGGVIDGFRKN